MTGGPSMWRRETARRGSRRDIQPMARKPELYAARVAGRLSCEAGGWAEGLGRRSIRGRAPRTRSRRLLNQDG